MVRGLPPTGGETPSTNKGVTMSDVRTSGGVGFFGLLAVLFIGLKLTGYVTWSWWWVLSPLWIPWVFVGAGLVLAILVAALMALVD